MSDQPTRKGRGCFYYGCIITLVVVVLGTVALYFGARYAIRSLVANYTDSAPEALPAVTVSDEQIADVQRRCAEFFETLKTTKAMPPLVLTADDLNLLVAASGTNRLRGRLHVTIEGDELKGRLSLPLDAVNARVLKGRYLNGTATLKVKLEDGMLDVRTESLLVKGKPVPNALMSKIRQQNLARDAMSDLNTATLIQSLESIVVTNGTVTVTAKEP
jgi:hypothetical protein